MTPFPQPGLPHLKITLRSDVHAATLHTPDPQRQDAVENEVGDNGVKRPFLGLLEAELEVIVECCTGDGDGGETEGETDVGEEMRLLKALRFHVLGLSAMAAGERGRARKSYRSNRIVRGVLELWNPVLAHCSVADTEGG